MTRDKATEIANTLHLLEDMEHIQGAFDFQLKSLNNCGIVWEEDFKKDLESLFDKYKKKYEQALNEVEE